MTPECNQVQFLRDAQTLIFLDYLHLAFIASQTRLVNDSGEKLSPVYLKKGEEMLPLLDKTQLQDHILHVQLKFNIIAMRITNLQQDENSLKRIKSLYNGSKKCFKKCDLDRINCFATRFYLEMVFLDAMLRFNDTERRNQSFAFIHDLIDLHPEHLENALVKFRLVTFYLIILELHMAQNDIVQVDRYYSKVIEMEPDTVFKALALHHRAFARLAVQQSFFKTQEKKLIQELIKSASMEWLVLQNKDISAQKHYRYILFQISLNYSLYKTADGVDEKNDYAKKIMQIFEESCQHEVLRSLEFGNLDVMATYLEVCFEMQKYDKILQFCENFQKGKSKLNVRLGFRDILKVAMVTASVCTNVTNGEKTAKTHFYINKLEQAMKLLEESSNWRKIFWFSCSNKLLYELNRGLGSVEKFRKFRSSSNFYLPSFYDNCSLLSTGSNKSSTTSLMEVIDIQVSSLKFIYVEDFHFRDLSHLQKYFGRKWRLVRGVQRLDDRSIQNERRKFFQTTVL